MTSEVIYTGELRTKATHARSGNSIITDAPLDNQGKGEAFSPTDLVATALASCMITIMGIRARDHSIDIVDAKAQINKLMAADPRRIARVEIVITMPEKNYDESQKILLQDAARGCPVCRSLSKELEIDLQFVW